MVNGNRSSCCADAVGPDLFTVEAGFRGGFIGFRVYRVYRVQGLHGLGFGVYRV